MSGSRGIRNLVIFVVLIGAAAAGFGYFKQSASLKSQDANATTAAAKPDSPAPAPKKLPPASDPIFHAHPDEIVLGKPDAPVTIIEYASLSCPHCAHFFKNVLPDLRKEYLDTGKAKLVFREFPLNAQALRAGQLVECADPAQRENFVRVLFEMQDQWAYTPDFLNGLKQIGLVGGVDAARFQSCIGDKRLEDKVLASRQEAVTVLNVNSTPTFYVNGKVIEGDMDIATFRAAIDAAKP